MQDHDDTTTAGREDRIEPVHAEPTQGDPTGNENDTHDGDRHGVAATGEAMDAGGAKRTGMLMRARTALAGRDGVSRWWWTVPVVLASGLLVKTLGWGNLTSTRHPIEGDQVSQNWWLESFAERFWSVFTGGHLFGWTDDFGAGQPFGYFYFPLPAVVFSLLQPIVGGGVAAKLLQLGSMAAVPAAVWHASNKLGGLRKSTAAAASTVSVLAFYPQKFPVGANVASSLIGEYSYGLGLAAAVVAAAASVEAVRSGTRWWRCGAWWAAALLLHLNAAFVVAAGTAAAIAVLGAGRDARRWRNVAQLWRVAAVAAGYAAFWVLPMWTMRGEIQGNNKLTDHMITWWFTDPVWIAVAVLGTLGLGIGWVRGSIGAKFFSILGAGAFAVYEVLTETTGFDLWSGRAMPVVYLALMIGTGELLAAGWSFLPGKIWSIVLAWGVMGAVAVAAAGVIEAKHTTYTERSATTWAGIGRGDDGARARVDELVKALEGLEPGRILYSIGPEGWKTYGAGDLNGEILRRTEGFSGASTFFHEANRGRFAVAYASSGVMTKPPGIDPSGMTIGLDDFDVGVEMMRQLGVRYYIVGEKVLHDVASHDSRLTPVANIGRVEDGENRFFTVFEVEDHGIVEAVRQEPGVVDVLPLWGESTWDGKVREWLRRQIDDSAFEGMYLVEKTPMDIEWTGRETYPKTEVSNVSVEDERVSFTVERTGVPVVVRMGYSPQWRVSGARGPFHVAPHGMIVIPEQREVVLEFEHPITERAGMAVSVATLIGGVAVRRRRRGSAQR